MPPPAAAPTPRHPRRGNAADAKKEKAKAPRKAGDPTPGGQAFVPGHAPALPALPPGWSAPTPLPALAPQQMAIYAGAPAQLLTSSSGSCNNRTADAVRPVAAAAAAAVCPGGRAPEPALVVTPQPAGAGPAPTAP
eukprot:gene13027-biopygen8476